MHDAIHEQCRDGDFGHAVQELEYDRCEHNAAEQHRPRDRNHTPGSGMNPRRATLRLFDFGEDTLTVDKIALASFGHLHGARRAM